MVTDPDSPKHLFLADSCPQAEIENTHLISSHSLDIGVRVLVTASCSCDKEEGSQTPRYGFVILYLTSPRNCNYLYTCSCDVRQAWGTEIVCENFYCSVANELKVCSDHLQRDSWNAWGRFYSLCPWRQTGTHMEAVVNAEVLQRKGILCVCLYSLYPWEVFLPKTSYFLSLRPLNGASI